MRFPCSLRSFKSAALDFWQLSKAEGPVCFGNPTPCGDELHTLQDQSPGEGRAFPNGARWVPSAAVPGLVCRWHKKGCEREAEIPTTGSTSKAETRERAGDSERFPAIKYVLNVLKPSWSKPGRAGWHHLMGSY